MANLPQAWTTASAALPNGWRIVGVMHTELYAGLAKLPAYLELVTTYPEQWSAMAAGPDGDPGEVGQGETPFRLCCTSLVSSSRLEGMLPARAPGRGDDAIRLHGTYT